MGYFSRDYQIFYSWFALTILSSGDRKCPENFPVTPSLDWNQTRYRITVKRRTKTIIIVIIVIIPVRNAIIKDKSLIELTNYARHPPLTPATEPIVVNMSRYTSGTDRSVRSTLLWPVVNGTGAKRGEKKGLRILEPLATITTTTFTTIINKRIRDNISNAPFWSKTKFYKICGVCSRKKCVPIKYLTIKLFTYISYCCNCKKKYVHEKQWKQFSIFYQTYNFILFKYYVIWLEKLQFSFFVYRAKSIEYQRFIVLNIIVLVINVY